MTGQKGDQISGAILADSMGLGKTIQIVSLIWILLKQNPSPGPQPFQQPKKNHKAPIVSFHDGFVKKVVIICPVSLVTNWQREVQKWLGDSRLSPIIAMGTRDAVLTNIKRFVNDAFRCIILSYETFTTNAKLFTKSCDLLICDEGHRLKNMKNNTYKALNSFHCSKKILLTGTPIQNSLTE